MSTFPADADEILAATPAAPAMVTPDMPSLTDLLHTLTPAQKRALDLVGRRDFFRAIGGWRARGAETLHVRTVAHLKACRLVRETATRMSVKLALTVEGKVVSDILRERAAATAGRRA